MCPALFYYWGGWAVNQLFNIAFGTHLTDLSTCYKIFPRSLVPELLAQPGSDFVFDVIELSRVVARHGIVEVPIHYHARSASEGKKLNWRHGVRCVWRIVTLFVESHARIFRFIVVGTTAMLVNLVVLYALTAGLGLWYLASEIVAFIIAVAYNFTLQKLWAFGGTGGSPTRQGFFFLLINIFNLALNTAILYALVQFFGLWYILAQVIASALIAFESFFVYRIIFR